MKEKKKAEKKGGGGERKGGDKERGTKKGIKRRKNQKSRGSPAVFLLA